MWSKSCETLNPYKALMETGTRSQKEMTTDTREKLIELLFDCVSKNLTPQQTKSDRLTIEIHHGDIADHLIANGVTFATDNNVGHKWIPVTERLPEKSGPYLVCSDREAVYETHFHTKKHFQNGYMREAGFTQRGKTIITHWMPLPQPPKGE